MLTSFLLLFCNTRRCDKPPIFVSQIPLRKLTFLCHNSEGDENDDDEMMMMMMMMMIKVKILT